MVHTLTSLHIMKPLPLREFKSGYKDWSSLMLLVNLSGLTLQPSAPAHTGGYPYRRPSQFGRLRARILLAVGRDRVVARVTF